MKNKLHKYISKNMIIQRRFAKKCDDILKNEFGETFEFCGATLHRLMHGVTLPKLTQALAIELVTDGEVSVYDWVTCQNSHIDRINGNNHNIEEKREC